MTWWNAKEMKKKGKGYGEHDKIPQPTGTGRVRRPSKDYGKASRERAKIANANRDAERKIEREKRRNERLADERQGASSYGGW